MASRADALRIAALEEVQDFRNYIEDNLVDGRNQDLQIAKFLPEKPIREYLLDEDKTKRLLRALCPLNKPCITDPPTVREEYAKILSILVMLDRGDLIHYFTRHDNLSDVKLPFFARPRNFPTLGCHPSLFDMFQQKQWICCVPKLQYNRDVHYEPEIILPIQKLVQHKLGGTAFIYRIRVHEDYDNLYKKPINSDALPTQQSDHWYALKRHHPDIDAERHYENESTVFRNLVDIDLENSNIIGFHGNFRHGFRFNIILEYAPFGTLEDYFSQRQPPAETTAIISFWEHLLGLLDALVRLHASADFSGAFYSSLHQDLRPHNILVTNSGFRLADFGLSNPRRSNDVHEHDGDADMYGTKLYGAPECYRNDELEHDTPIKVTQAVDIWSLGAVLSEAATWLTQSREGLKHYRGQRRQCHWDELPKFANKGCFHDGENVLGLVLAKHEQIKAMKRENDLVTNQVIDRLLLDMLKPAMERPNAKRLRRTSLAIIEDAKERQRLLCPSPPRTLPNGSGSPQHRWFDSDGLSISNLNSVLSSHGTVTMSPYTTTPDENATGVLHHTVSNTTDTPQTPPSFFDSPEISDAGSPRLQHDSPLALNESSFRNRAAEFHVPSQDVTFGGAGGADHAYRSEGRYPEPADPAFAAMLRRARPATTPRPIPFLSVGKACVWAGPSSGSSSRRSLPLKELNDLKARDHVFLIDDSGTMHRHWQELIRLVLVLAEMVRHMDEDGFEVYFTMSDVEHKSKNTSGLERLLQGLCSKNTGSCNMSLRLNRILRGYQNKLQAPFPARRRWSLIKKLSEGTSLGKKQSEGPPPLSVYVLTDGLWQECSSPENDIKDISMWLDELRLPKEQVGIQFIRFGDDQDARLHLEHLDSGLGLVKDIVDTEPANGNVCKMLLGAVNNWFDGDRTSGSSPNTTFTTL